jgi:hypothetical protein
MKPTIVDIAHYKQGTTTRGDLSAILATLEKASELPAPRFFVEFGTHLAGTSKVIIQALNELQCASVFAGMDIAKPQDHARGGKFVARDMWEQECSGIASIGPCKARFIEGQSFELAKTINDPVTWVFVDGCHCYDCVAKDIQSWGEKVVPGGYLLAHDCHPDYKGYQEQQFYHGTKAVGFGVIEAVADSKLLKDQFDFICQTPPKPLSRNRLFGGLQVYRRKSG